jgi:TPR repeat protein
VRRDREVEMSKFTPVLATVLIGVASLGASAAVAAPAKPAALDSPATAQAWADFDRGDYARAVPALRQLAEAGDSEAQTAMGWISRKGLGVPRNTEASFAWYGRAAAAGNPRAQFAYADAATLGLLSEKERMRWTRRSAEHGYAPAQALLGRLYARGERVPRDDEAAIAWLRKAADQGLPEAQLDLGQMHAAGRVVPVSAAEARNWYLRAAQQGHSVAQARLGAMSLQGDGGLRDGAVPRGPDRYPDPVEAARWFALCNDRAGLDLALRRMTPEQTAQLKTWLREWRPTPEWRPGRVLTQADDKALWLDHPSMLEAPYVDDSLPDVRAAEADFDFPRARQLALKAAEAGNPRAQAHLADMLLEGIGGPRDVEASRDWMRRVAAQGEVGSQLHLAVLLQAPGAFQRGEPDAVALAEAYRWALTAGINPRATKSDRNQAMRLAQDIASRLSPEAEAGARREAQAAPAGD